MKKLIPVTGLGVAVIVVEGGNIGLGGGGGAGGITVWLTRSISMSIVSCDLDPMSWGVTIGGLDSWLDMACGVLGWLNIPVSMGVPEK